MIIQEKCGPSSRTFTYKVSEDSVLEAKQDSDAQSVRWTLWISRWFSEIFLPFGYPASVTEDYAAFQFWDVLQDSSGALLSSIAMESNFKAAGVGSENRSALAAVMALLIMDIAAKVGEALFVWSKGRAMDYDNKKMRFLTAILHDIGIVLQLVIPLFQDSSTAVLMFLLCASSIASAVAGVGAGSTRMSLTAHQAKANNGADVWSKSQCQRQAARLLCNGICLGLMPYVSGNQTILVTLYTFLIFLGLFCDYRSCKCVQLKFLNTERLLICLKQFLENGSVPSIREANRAESLWIGFGMKDKDVCNFRIHLGASIAALKDTRLNFDEPFSQTLKKYEDLPFVILTSTRNKLIHVILRENADSLQILEAYVSCIIGSHFFKTGAILHLDMLHPTITLKWTAFQKSLETAGYNLKQVSLRAGESRAKWKDL